MAICLKTEVWKVNAWITDVQQNGRRKTIAVELTDGDTGVVYCTAEVICNFKMMDFILKMMDYILYMMEFYTKHDEFCMKGEFVDVSMPRPPRPAF